MVVKISGLQWLSIGNKNKNETKIDLMMIRGAWSWVEVLRYFHWHSVIRTGDEVDFSPSNIRRVMRFKRETAGAETDYNTRKAIDQRLDEVLRDLCIPGATWKMSSSQPAVPV
ncbi:hypothetical protein PIB30_097547 [Stylosanthes scabra]|uniref:Uncharacterized protein n=1 Tax=Stylosanthes scabra TaxID=79078 RepID=A0ABU6W011_9FABA|nr:hypothetical protein [Stylosanthes scabra]